MVRLLVSCLASFAVPMLSTQGLCVQVHLQTQQLVSKGVTGMAVEVVKTKGVLALYNGLTASLGRQVHSGL